MAIVTTSGGQKWHVYISINWIHTHDVLSKTGDQPKWDLINREFSKINNTTKEDLTILPVFIPDGREFSPTSREFHRGSEYDKNPFIYRGKNIPEFEAKLSHKFGLEIYPYISFKPVTDGAKKFIRALYGPDLHGLITDEILALCKQEAKTAIVKYFKAEVENYKRQLEAIAAFPEDAATR